MIDDYLVWLYMDVKLRQRINYISCCFIIYSLIYANLCAERDPIRAKRLTERAAYVRAGLSDYLHERAKRYLTNVSQSSRCAQGAFFAS